jgi:hypothetical protein
MTAATLAGCVRDVIVDWGLVSGRCWQDNAPTKPTLPYVTIEDTIDASPALSGDGRMMKVQRTMQVSLWQAGQEYDATLIAGLADTLDGAALEPVGGGRYGLSVQGWNRLRESDTNIVQSAFTLTVTHDRSTA